MIPDTIQNALKRLFCSIGGNADNVRNKDDINAILDEMTALNIGKEISGAGTNVVANPTLAGTEDPLTGLEVDGTKYKVGGSGGGVLVVQEDGETGVLDKTWQEIHDADVAFVVSILGDNYKSYSPIIETNEESGSFSVTFCGILNNNGTLEFWASVYATDSADGYPTAE